MANLRQRYMARSTKNRAMLDRSDCDWQLCNLQWKQCCHLANMTNLVIVSWAAPHIPSKLILFCITISTAVLLNTNTMTSSSLGSSTTLHCKISWKPFIICNVSVVCALFANEESVIMTQNPQEWINTGLIFKKLHLNLLITFKAM